MISWKKCANWVVVVSFWLCTPYCVVHCLNYIYTLKYLCRAFYIYVLSLVWPCHTCRHGLPRSQKEEQLCRKNSFGCCPHNIMHSGAQAIFQFQYAKPGIVFVLYLNILLIFKYCLWWWTHFLWNLCVSYIIQGQAQCLEPLWPG